MRYFFNIRSPDDYVEDSVGQELASLDVARSEAEQSAREIVAEQVKHGEVINGRTFEIADAAGAILATVPFRSALKLG